MSTGNDITQLQDDNGQEEGDNIPRLPDVFPGAGVGLPRPLPTYQHDYPECNPLFPFESNLQWDFCSTHLEENAGKNILDRMIGHGVFKGGINITNADHFRRLVHEMGDGIDCKWEEGTIEVEGTDVKYWYRDPKVILRYLFSHLPFKDHLAYGPIRDYGSDGKRLYSEMWSGNWWWKQQVKQL